ncbi:MAG: hypothetical protein K0Q76_3066, partial [Panacagrimonas sp.]|nr:hypothetical protein [Panacagrimonas sp.]
FSSQAHFTEYFRRDTGATPRAFRCDRNWCLPGKR